MKDKTQILVISNIEWDAPASAKLPEEETVEITPDTQYLLEDIDGYSEEISDWLSNKYGYCVFGYSTDLILKDTPIDGRKE